MEGPNSKPPWGGYRASPHPTPYQRKAYYVSGTKIFLRRYIEIYRHLLSKCFKNAVLGRQEMGQCKCFFWHQTESCLVEHLERFLAVLWESILFSMSVKFKFIKWVRFFEPNCIVNWLIFFTSFCWLWDFLPENLKLK